MDEQDKKIDFVRLSRGITRAAARTIVMSGEQLQADWPEALATLYAGQAKAADSQKKAETFTPKPKA